MVDRTVTVQPGINMLKLNEELRRTGSSTRTTPPPTPSRSSGGRIGTSGWSLIGGRYGHTRDLVISFEIVLPTGEHHRGRGRGRQKAAQVVDGLPAQAPLHGASGQPGDRHRGDSRAGASTRSRVRRLFRLPRLRHRVEVHRGHGQVGLATLAGVVLFDEKKVEYLRRDDEAYIPQPDDLRCVVATAMYGTTDEVRPAAKRLMRIGKETGGELPGRRGLAGRLGVAPRPLRHPAPRAPPRRAGGADELALRGLGAQLQRAPPGARGVARHRREVHRALRDIRRLGDVLSTPTPPTSLGATTWWRSTSGSGSKDGRGDCGPLGCSASGRSPR